MKKLIILIGGSGTGKTTTEKLMIKRNDTESVISHTTRDARPGEIHGREYYFTNVKEIFQIKQANLIKITDDWYYSVSESELLKDTNYLVYSVINIEFANQLVQYIKNNSLDIDVTIVYFNISKAIRIQKMVERGESKKDVTIRLNREDTLTDFEKYSIKPDYIETVMDENMQNRIMEFCYGSEEN